MNINIKWSGFSFAQEKNTSFSLKNYKSDVHILVI